MMEEEVTENTQIARETQKGPSVWINAAALLGLAALIWGGHRYVERWSQPAPAPIEESERHIILEDLETEKPLIESEAVEVPAADVPKTEIVPQKSAKPEVKKNAPPPAPRAASPVRDPYTNGSALDLDRPENWDQYFPGRPKEGFIKKKIPPSAEAAATPLFPSERDQFIPFEKEKE